jgi:pyruvate formate lyase activating enzyme
MTISEVVAGVMGDSDFFQGTGGGVTFSGGEPLIQPAFVLACADALRAHGTHVAVETAGLWPSRLAAELSAQIDLVLFDLKHVLIDVCKTVLGSDYGPALANLEVLLESALPVEVRITLVPDFNDTEEDLQVMARWLRRRARGVPLRLQPFHRLGAAKEGIFGCSYPYAGVPPTPRERLARAVEIMRAAGLDAYPA